jgi:hypothetical protein
MLFCWWLLTQVFWSLYIKTTDWCKFFKQNINQNVISIIWGLSNFDTCKQWLFQPVCTSAHTGKQLTCGNKLVSSQILHIYQWLCFHLELTGSWQPVHLWLQGACECLMAGNIWNGGKLLTLLTAWWHYVPQQAVQLTCRNLFIICQQLVAVISFISHLFSVTINEQCVMSWCGIL